MSEPKVIFATGGTGGHLFPAVAIAEELKRRRPKAEILFIATEEFLPIAYDYEMRTIKAQTLPRKFSFGFFSFPIVFATGFLQSICIILSYRPSLVIGTGGYLSAPMVFAAHISRIPIILQEQNSFPGLATRTLAKYACQIHLSFLEAAQFFKEKQKLFISGNPTRRQIGTVSKEKSCSKLSLLPSKTTVLILGGSQGSHSINNAFYEALILLKNEDIQVIWQTGKIDYNWISKGLKSNLKVILKDFLKEEMIWALGAADIVIARAGGTTLAELTKCGLPAILVPYPYAAEGHQQKNAEIMVRSGAAILIPENQLNGKRLATNLSELIRDKSRLSEMAHKSKSLGTPEAVENILRAIEESHLI